MQAPRQLGHRIEGSLWVRQVIVGHRRYLEMQEVQTTCPQEVMWSLVPCTLHRLQWTHTLALLVELEVRDILAPN